MEEHVLERNLQEVLDAEGAALRGDDGAVKVLLNRLMGFIRHPSKWQWVIHGETALYRGWVVQWLMGQERYKMARRFALCGRGDIALCREDAQAARVKPQGCGARFCPRCSRRFGRRFLARVASHLSSRPHGGLWHVVLTQQVLPYEDLEHSRERFGIAWKRAYAGLRKIGMRSGLATYHVKRSRGGGWHYHCHLVTEFPEGIDEETLYQGLNERWRKVVSKHESHRDYKELFMRHVCDAGPALVGMKENTQLDFWSESQDQVETLLHYVIRDVLQGIESWVACMEREQDCFDFCEFMGAAKRHRTYGKWRLKVKGDDTEAKADAEERALSEATREKNKAKGDIEWSALSTVDSCLRDSRSGSIESSEALKQLIGCTNRSKGVLFRLRKLTTWLAA